MPRSLNSSVIVGLVTTGIFAIVAGAQVLPCWKTVNTGQTACQVWWDENPFVACEPPSFTIDQQVYRADRAASPWSQPIVQYAECSGPYKIKEEEGNCVVDQMLSWQTTGTQGGGGSCPGQPGEN